ncbi:hypothetical protein Skr01_36550 [Sphaerisporangium krabiense]|uniref:HTH merR-type domain-containing protein n=1 Tax=Sphaerisporangium krabiense TaxID=763782 RepID=A0A7W9DQP1_9ACTN|nr:MerR family transcriptional regulator [Sphaerisporangium krabiense]MBB5626650.1 hypothetical protein [Sphaerisporangium krabiense]GII63570.1 hypothetical protein Skr01_36550 [Sphaerisporangium krabiense]
MTRGAKAVVEATGVPRTTLMRWVEEGLLQPRPRGRGTPQEWPAAEVAIAVLLARLVAAGMHTAPAAAVARTVVAFGLDEVELGQGLTLKIAPPPI